MQHPENMRYILAHNQLESCSKERLIEMLTECFTHIVREHDAAKLEAELASMSPEAAFAHLKARKTEQL
jgi:hypothetical protein